MGFYSNPVLALFATLQSFHISPMAIRKGNSKTQVNLLFEGANRRRLVYQELIEYTRYICKKYCSRVVFKAVVEKLANEMSPACHLHACRLNSWIYDFPTLAFEDSPWAWIIPLLDCFWDDYCRSLQCPCVVANRGK